ncbi:MAG: hypothetical protein QOF51_391 [Chloroflexota bacterium]|jgi:hypothetical protein|nr:hypothetical protein [Chloroflexota bacterium]
MGDQRKVRAILAAAHFDGEQQVREHERRYHDVPEIPPTRTDPITAVPWANERIPDDVLAQMIEALEAEPDVSLEEVAERHNCPPSLTFRELVTYARVHKRWAIERALKIGTGTL